MAKAHHDYYERFLDAPLKALNEMSPRAASRDAAIRPKLIEVIKNQLHGLDVQNREQSRNLSLDWILDELGLPELK